jgi:hypothetical protein
MFFKKDNQVENYIYGMNIIESPEGLPTSTNLPALPTLSVKPNCGCQNVSNMMMKFLFFFAFAAVCYLIFQEISCKDRKNDMYFYS